MRTEEAICKAKHRYANLRIALVVAHDYLVIDGVIGIPYPCQVCKGWHLTHQGSKTHVRAMKQMSKKARKAKMIGPK